MSTLYVNTITPNSGDTVSVSGSLFVSGTINLGDANTDSVAFGADVSSSIIPDSTNVYDLGSSTKVWRKLHGTASAASHSLTAFTATSASHATSVASAQSNITSVGILTGLNVNGAITASQISCSGTVIADIFQSTGNDDTLSFEDNLKVSGSIVASGQLSGSSAVIDGDLSVGDDLSLTSDSAVFNMGAGNDFKITHNGALGADITANQLRVKAGTALNLSGSEVNMTSSVGDISIIAADDIILEAADNISLTSTSADGLITLHSAHTAGQSILIDANANAGSILDVDAGILDIDVQAATTIDAVGIALNAGSGEMDLTTTGILDVNVDSLDMDLTNSSSITLTSNQTGEDLTIALVGATDSSLILSSTGTGADALQISSSAGGIDVIAASTLDVDALELDIDTTSTASITSTLNSANAILLHANGGTAETIKIHSDQGTGAGSIELTSDAGSIDINAGDDITIDASDNMTLTAADNVTVQSSTADGLVTLYSAHTAGVAFHIDANANAASEVQIDAGILDIDVTGAATVDADSITLTGAVTAATGVQSSAVARTATDDGSGNGTIAAGTSVVLVDADSDANHIIVLPAPVVGNIITIIENGTTGYELRTSTPASIGINGGTGANAESAIAGAITYIRCVCVSSTSWIATQFDADGDESKVEAAA